MALLRRPVPDPHALPRRLAAVLQPRAAGGHFREAPDGTRVADAGTAVRICAGAGDAPGVAPAGGGTEVAGGGVEDGGHGGLGYVAGCESERGGAVFEVGMGRGGEREYRFGGVWWGEGLCGEDEVDDSEGGLGSGMNGDDAIGENVACSVFCRVLAEWSGQ